MSHPKRIRERRQENPYMTRGASSRYDCTMMRLADRRFFRPLSLERQHCGRVYPANRRQPILYTAIPVKSYILRRKAEHTPMRRLDNLCKPRRHRLVVRMVR